LAVRRIDCKSCQCLSVCLLLLWRRFIYTTASAPI